MAYAYQIEDKSLLVPILKKHLWAPAMVLVPQRSSANTLTLIGNGLSASAFVLLALARPLGAPDWLYVAPAILLFVFLSLDNMDGMQARRTGRCTPYGEYLDHWGDTFNMGFSTLGFGLAMELPPWMILTSLGLCQLANFAQFWEQRVTGWLRFGHVGGTEGILLLSLLYAAVPAFGWEGIARTPLVGPATFAHLFWGTACAGFVVAGVSCLWRVRRPLRSFTTLFLTIVGVALWHAFGGLGILPAAFALALAGSLLVGRQVSYRILERDFPTFEWPLLLLVLGGALLGVFGSAGRAAEIAAWLPCTYLGLRLAADFLDVTASLAQHLRDDELVSVCLRPLGVTGRRRG